MRQVRPAVGLRQRQQQVALGQVADQEDVEAAVVGLGVGQHLHPAAEVAAVGDDHVVHATAVLVAVDPHRDLVVAPAREDGERRPRVRDLAAERLGRLVGALGDRAAHAGAGDVREQRLAFGAVPAEVARAPKVDLSRPAAQRDLDRGLELARDAVGADEVPAGAARDHGQLDVEAGDPVDDLVHGAVAADRHEQRRRRRGLARELGQVARPLGEQRVALQPERGRLVRELRPAPTRRAVLGRGVDQEDRVANGRRSRSRARRASCGRPRRAARRPRCA